RQAAEAEAEAVAVEAQAAQEGPDLEGDGTLPVTEEFIVSAGDEQ
ncbi:MAG: hypothetical protein HY871_01270, partial [Chloroflexi bacterium]|nr:hypothetical protein [Chloroflexota bacterium]